MNERPSIAPLIVSITGLAFIVTLAIDLRMGWGTVVERITWATINAIGALFFSIGMFHIVALGAFTEWYRMQRRRFEFERESMTLIKTVNDALKQPGQPVIRNRQAWIDYWLAALEYAEQVGGVSYQRTKDFFANDDPTWKECFALPMVREGYLNPIEPRKETTLAQGWTVEKIRWRIENNIGVPAPPLFDPPNRFRKQTTADTSQKQQNTASNRETGEST